MAPQSTDISRINRRQYWPHLGADPGVSDDEQERAGLEETAQPSIWVHLTTEVISTLRFSRAAPMSPAASAATAGYTAPGRCVHNRSVRFRRAGVLSLSNSPEKVDRHPLAAPRTTAKNTPRIICCCCYQFCAHLMHNRLTLSDGPQNLVEAVTDRCDEALRTFRAMVGAVPCTEVIGACFAEDALTMAAPVNLLSLPHVAAVGATPERPRSVHQQAT